MYKLKDNVRELTDVMFNVEGMLNFLPVSMTDVELQEMKLESTFTVSI